MGENDDVKRIEEKRYLKKPKERIIHELKWVSELFYKDHKLTVMTFEIQKEGKAEHVFQWITRLTSTKNKVLEFAKTGRKRWMIENEGFNIQKNHRYQIKHANSLNNTAMKNHYLLTQIADILLQLYENGVSELRKIKKP